MTAPALTIQKVHWRTLLRQRGELVNYDTGLDLITDIKIVVTRPAENQIDLSMDGAIAMESKEWDVLIDPDTILDSGGNRIVPAVGHRIIRATGLILMVQNRSGSNCWRWSDALETWRRVHATCNRER
ncbi:MAG: hypothetical protein U0930_20010 [Pirellulales bacterium]